MDLTPYADIVEAGGLGPALDREARLQSIDLGPISVPVGDREYVYAHATVADARGWVAVSLAVDQRSFGISIANPIHGWAMGESYDLAEVVQVAAYWRNGATLRQLHERFPFMTYSRQAQGYEDGDSLNVRWDDLLEDKDLTLIRPVLQAARSNEALQRTYPSVTHFRMARFEVDNTRRQLGEVRITITAEGRYEVESDWVTEPQTVTSVEDAIREAVTQLRSG